MLFRPLLGTDLSGSVGGITASHNRGGAYFRERVIPVNPATPQQGVVRAIVSSLAGLWQSTLTSAQRSAWETYAANTPVQNAIGAEIFLTGLNMYIRSNTPILQASLPRVDDGPIIFGLPTYSAVAIASLTPPTAVTVAFTNTDLWANENNGALLIFLSRPTKQTINFFKGPYRIAGVVLGDAITPPTTPAAITAPFVFAAGQRVFMRMNVVRTDGRLGAESRTFRDS